MRRPFGLCTTCPFWIVCTGVRAKTAADSVTAVAGPAPRRTDNCSRSPWAAADSALKSLLVITVVTGVPLIDRISSPRRSPPASAPDSAAGDPGSM
jgi:hypothetical protein